MAEDFEFHGPVPTPSAAASVSPSRDAAAAPRLRGSRAAFAVVLTAVAALAGGVAFLGWRAPASVMAAPARTQARAPAPPLAPTALPPVPAPAPLPVAAAGAKPCNCDPLSINPGLSGPQAAPQYDASPVSMPSGFFAPQKSAFQHEQSLGMAAPIASAKDCR